MIGLISPIVVFVVAFAALPMFVRNFSSREQRLIRLGLLAHMFGAVAIIAIYKYYYGYGDMLVYHKSGGLIASYMSADLSEALPKVLQLLFQQGGEELVPHAAGRSTGSMHAIAALLSFLLGESLLGSCAVIASGAFYGKLALYKVFRSELPRESHRVVLIGTLLVPSAVFWSSGILKESVVMLFLGLMVWGAHSLATGSQRSLGLISAFVGVIGCGLIKAYLLIPAAVAAIVWLYVRRSNRLGKGLLSRPIYLIAAGLLVLGMLAVLGSQFPKYNVFSAEKILVAQQEASLRHEGGSTFRLTDAAPSSQFGLMLTSPWAVTTALLRPAIIEARNPLSLMNGIETLVLTIMLIRVLRRRGIAGSIRLIRNSPVLSFCAAFTLLLAIGVGFATTNMGALSRYRMPLLPFFVVLLAVLGKRESRARSRRLAPAPRGPARHS